MYQYWFDKEEEHGNFVTKLFEAYRGADGNNKYRLSIAFPELFVLKYNRPYTGRLGIIPKTIQKTYDKKW